jgi:predicted transcriptional regulator
MAGHKQKVSRPEVKRAKREARKLLRSERFFNHLLDALERDGLVGEKKNALVLYNVVSSRIIPHPLNVFVKGQSSAGKNFLIKKVLRLLPKHAIADITSVSDTAWSYMGDRLRNKVVYIPERNDAVGKIEPLRMLISEDKLIRRVTKNIGGKNITTKYVARGPVASISTTTKKQLQIDDESRHLSISIIESAEQTRKIVRSYARPRTGLSREDLRTWHTVQRLLERRIGVDVTLPEWFPEVADGLPIKDLRVRRYFPAFIEACNTVCLIRSFQRRKSSKENRLTVDFADFAMAALIFDHVFVESLRLRKGVNESTRDLVDRLSARKERPVEAKDVARELRISMDRAHRMLRNAEAAGVIERANEPEKGNSKLYVAVPPPRFVPDPKRLFRKLHLKKTVRIIHPITGEEIVYRRKK